MTIPKYYLDQDAYLTVGEDGDYLPSGAAKKNVVLVTHSLMFDFQDGTRVTVPPPGEGWTQCCGKVYHWNYPYVINACVRWVSTENTDERPFLVVKHEAGMMILKEYCERMKDDPARILAWIQWAREAEV